MSRRSHVWQDQKVAHDAWAFAAAKQWIERWPPFLDVGFASADGDEDAEADDGPFGVNPVAAYLLSFLLECMSDDWGEDDGGSITRDEFPRSLRVWLLDDEFTAAMARSCLDLSTRLQSNSHNPTTTCTADEVNLAMACRLAVDTGFDLLVDDPVLTALVELAGPIDISYEVELARELLTHDADVDHLWNPALDGIENDIRLQESQGITHLHPSAWFITF
jgi:hypothetical protein